MRFRPLSGSYRFLCLKGRAYVIPKQVSVPCRGLIGFYKLKIRNTEGSENGFRPLSGSYRFLLIMQVETMLNEEIGFRPLSGSYKFL